MINVYVISGFLGAGKTTFIQKLLSEKKFEKAMLLENEFGEVGVDAAFFDKSLKVREINNGCICCSLQGDFKQALEEIEELGVSDLLIEPSGVGKLSEILDVIKDDEDFRIVSHICIVDVKTANKYHKNFKDYFDDQVKAANAIVLSHLDVAEKDKIDSIISLIKELNPNALISDKPIDDYKFDELMNIIISGGEIINECEHHEHEHHHHHHEEGEHHHHHDDDDDEDEDFKNYIMRPNYVFKKEELENILNNLNEDIIRAKGYVNGEEGTLYFNYILNEANIYYGDKQNDTLVVIIGSTINKKEMAVLFHE